MSETFIPVFKDTYYETTAETLTYSILCDGLTIFRGKAVKGPKDALLRVNINRVAQDYLLNEISDFRASDGQIHTHPEAFRIFELRDANEQLLETYGVLADYGRPFDGRALLLSDPVRKQISPAMKYTISIYSPSGQTGVIDYVPIITNTYFRPSSPTFSVPFTGGTARITFETDYYPAEAIIPSASVGGITFSRVGDGYVDITIPANAGIEANDFEIYFSYDGRRIGTISVSQAGLTFDLITETLSLNSTGGTYQIQWTTDGDPTKISAQVCGWTATVSDITATGCSASITTNPTYTDVEFEIAYYYDLSGTPYRLDGTQVLLRGKSGATSGDTGTTTGSTIETGITRDLTLTQDGAFAGFNSPGIQIWPQINPGPGFYYPRPLSTYELSYNGGILFTGGMWSNIPLCSYSDVCPSEEHTNKHKVESAGYSLSSDTRWLQDYLDAAKDADCDTYYPGETYTGSTARYATLYLKSGSTVLDENIIIQPPYGGWNTNYRVLSTITPFKFSDFKYKTQDFNESSARSFLRNVIPVWNYHRIYDGVFNIQEQGIFTGSNWSVYMDYDVSAFEFERDGDWIIVKTPMPIREIAAVSGLGATEVWISRNVRIFRGGGSYTGLTAATYEGTVQDFRSVRFSDWNNTAVQCSDGVSYSTALDLGKADAVVFSGNKIRPSLCDEYFYDTDEPTVGNTITYRLTGTTVPASMIRDGLTDTNVFTRSGRNPIVVSTTTSITDGFAVVEITYEEDIIGTTRIPNSYVAEVSDTLLYYYAEGNGNNAAAGKYLETASNKLRAISANTFSGNEKLSAAITMDNLRYVGGRKNFAGSSVRTLRAPNLIYIAENAFSGSSIEEFYIPSVQYIYSDAFPATTTKITIGKSWCFGSYAFRSATALTELYFNGSVAEWEKLLIYNGDASRAISGSNIDTVFCNDGEWSRPQ